MNPSFDASVKLKTALNRAILFPLLFIILLLAFLFSQGSHLWHASEAVGKSEHVISTIYKVEKLLGDLEIGLRGFLMTGDYEILGPYTDANVPLLVALRDLRNFAADNVIQQQRLRQIELGIATWDNEALSLIRHRDDNLPAVRLRASNHARIMTQTKTDLAGFLAGAEFMMQERRVKMNQALQGSLLTGIGLMFFIGLMLTFFTRRQLWQVSASYRMALQIAGDRERRLEQSEAQFRFLTSMIPQIVWTTDATGKFDFCNEGWFKYSGLERTHGFENGLWPAIHTEDRKRVVESWNQSVITGLPFQGELRLRDAHGGYRWHLARAVPFRGADDQITKWFGTCTDIEEQKHREQIQRFLADASAVLTSTLKLENALNNIAKLAVPGHSDWCLIHEMANGESIRLVVANHLDHQVAARITEMIRKQPETFEDNYGPRHVIRSRKPEFISNLNEAFLSSAMRSDDFRQLLKSLKICSYISVPLEARGKVLGAVTFAQAESGRHFSESDFELLQSLANRIALAMDNRILLLRAEQANKAKDDFLATLSHELRTPLNVILGWIELLKAGQLNSDAYQEGLQTLERNAKLQGALINDLLDVSRIISGKLKIEMDEADTTCVVRDAVESAYVLAKTKGVALDLKISTDAPPVRGDSNRLQQVVWNLLTNAIKFTPPGGRVEVTLNKCAKTNGACISVTDTGCGIDSVFLPHVFERFVQESNAPARGHMGLGLGLAIVKHIVMLHGGTVEVHSMGRGKGSTFLVILPAATLSGQAQSKYENRQPQEARPSQSLNGLKIFVVDDSPDVLHLISLFLRKEGADVVVAASGRELFEKLKTEKPDVLLCDIGMPDMDGYDVIKEVRHLGLEKVATVPAAALTAYARPEERKRALGAGFQMHLAKPITSNELIDSVLKLSGRGDSAIRLL